MPTKAKPKKQQAIWQRHCHDYLGADTYETCFPSLYGTGISISTFPPKKILTLGEVLQESLRKSCLISCEDHLNNKRVYAYPNSEADTKLSLNCCFEGDSVDWDINSAFFREGKLVAVVSMADLRDEAAPPEYEDELRHGDLAKIHRFEIRRLARGALSHKGDGDPYKEFLAILKAQSPSGQGLHDSYREAIKGILRPSPSDDQM